MNQHQKHRLRMEVAEATGEGLSAFYWGQIFVLDSSVIKK